VAEVFPTLVEVAVKRASKLGKETSFVEGVVSGERPDAYVVVDVTNSAGTKTVQTKAVVSGTSGSLDQRRVDDVGKKERTQVRMIFCRNSFMLVLNFLSTDETLEK
jgi:hypothetical protein